MEQSLMEQDLRARSKKAMILGILANVIPAVLIFLIYIGWMVGFFGYIGANYSNINGPESVFPLFGGLFLALAAAGVAMLVLGIVAWVKAKGIWTQAKEASLRKPGMSIAAFVLGLEAFVSGLIVTLLFVLYAGVISALPGMIQMMR